MRGRTGRDQSGWADAGDGGGRHNQLENNAIRRGGRLVGGHRGGTATVLDTAKALEPSDLYQQVIGSVFLGWELRRDKGQSTGTGVLVGDNMVLTAFHVIDGMESVSAYSPARDAQGDVITAASYYRDRGVLLALPCKVIASDPLHDLALLRVRMSGTPATPIAVAAASAKAGDPCFTIGNSGVNQDALWRLSTGIVRLVYHAKHTLAGGQKIDSRIISTQTPTNPGDSGGPLFDKRGALIGTNSSNSKTENLVQHGVDVMEIRAFLSKAGYDVTGFKGK